MRLDTTRTTLALTLAFYNLQDSAIEVYINEVATGLFGVIATMGVIPVIRAQPGEAAEMVARVLHKMIQVRFRFV